MLMPVLQEKGLDVVRTREPGGTDIGDQIRSVIMNMKNKSMHPRAEILLFCASRAQLVEELIRPSLKEGKLVLCDRYADSTLAYQGYGHGLDLETLSRLLDFTTGGLKPDLTLLFDIPAEAGLRRRLSNHDEWNRMDDYALDTGKAAALLCGSERLAEFVGAVGRKIREDRAAGLFGDGGGT